MLKLGSFAAENLSVSLHCWDWTKLSATVSAA